MEDDAVLSASLPQFLKTLEAEKPPVDLLRLETDLNGQRLMPRSDAVIAGVEIRQSWSWAAGSAAYLVSRQAAKTIVDSQELLRRQADAALFNPYIALGQRLRMRHCVPALAVQDDRLDARRRDSDIAKARAQHKAPPPLPWPIRTFRTIAGICETEIVHGSQRQFHTIFGGARKVPVPFSAD